MMRPVSWKLIVDDHYTVADLRQAVASGARFVVFPYCISLGLVRLRMFSPAYFLHAGTLPEAYRSRYDRISKICGWWSILGPTYTLTCLRTNRKGGLDVTADILANLTEEDLKDKKVTLKKASILFERPQGSERTSFQQAILTKLEDHTGIDTIIAALYVNVERNQKPFFVIGLRVSGPVELYEERIMKALHKKFYRHITFKFIHLNAEPQHEAALREQGLILWDHGMPASDLRGDD